MFLMTSLYQILSFKQCLDQQVSAQSQCVSQSIDVVYSLAGGSDYAEIRTDNFDVFLTFDNDNCLGSFSVAILNDSLLELDVEDFTLELRFAIGPVALQRPSNVILSPNISTVEIVDDDCKI